MAVLTENQLRQIDGAIRDLLSPKIQQHAPGFFQDVAYNLGVLRDMVLTPTPQLTASEKMHQGCFAETHIEEILDALWPDMVGRVGADHYDNSLEIYFIPDAPDTLVCTEAQATGIIALGFSRFWMNFCDGTEQTVVGPCPWTKEQVVIGPRQKANLPRGGVRQSMLRSRLYAEIDRLEKKVRELEDAPGLAVRKLNLISAYVQHGSMTKDDFNQLLKSDGMELEKYS